MPRDGNQFRFGLEANMPVAYMNYKWNDKWIEESAASWAMNVSTPATNEATLLTASR